MPTRRGVESTASGTKTAGAEGTRRPVVSTRISVQRGRVRGRHVERVLQRDRLLLRGVEAHAAVLVVLAAAEHPTDDQDREHDKSRKSHERPPCRAAYATRRPYHGVLKTDGQRGFGGVSGSSDGPSSFS